MIVPSVNGNRKMPTLTVCRRIHMSRSRALIATILAGCGLALSASPAHAVFGDTYDFTSVNVPGAQASAALPGTKAWWAGACDLSSGVAEVGTPPGVRGHCIDWGVPNEAIVGDNSWITPPNWRLQGATAAGSHPDGTATMAIQRVASRPDGSPDNIRVDLPTGFVADPNAVPKCAAHQFAVKPSQCPAESQVGIALIALADEVTGALKTGTYPVYNLEPRHGLAAELGIPDVVAVTSVRIVARARTGSDFGVTAMVTQIPTALPIYQQMVTLWGVPWAEQHDLFRAKQGFEGGIDPNGLAPADRAIYTPAWGKIRPFASNITRCDGREPNTRAAIDTFEHPGALTPWGDADYSDPDWAVADAAAPAVDRCGDPPFQVAAGLPPTSKTWDSAAGLDVGIDLPANDEPPASVAGDPSDATGAPAYWKSAAGRATAHLDKTVVELAEGLTVNPSGAAGLAGCSDAGVGVRQQGSPPLFNNGDPFDGDAGDGAECPKESIIGTTSVRTPLLERPLTGQVVLGEPKSTDPQSGEMFRIFLVVRDEERGLIAKIYGSSVADPNTGKLTATFDKNPQVPVERVDVDLNGGERGVLATPPSCGAKQTRAVFTPWTATHGAGGVPVQVDDVFSITGGDCVRDVRTSLGAGMSNGQARGTGTFSFQLGRADGDQYMRGLTAELPRGLLASVRGVPLCTNAQIDEYNRLQQVDPRPDRTPCPEGSRIGTVDAKAGAGDPFVLERKGVAYLTKGYRGAPYGLAVWVPVEAGPFRGSLALSPVLVRQALHVDRRDASVTAISDPLPLIHHGVVLRMRQVTVLVDRANFMRNPSSCSPKQITAIVTGDEGNTASSSVGFRPDRCRDLPFKPRLKMALTGRKQAKTGGHPGVKAQVKQAGIGESGIDRFKVRLPRSLALDPDNAQSLCEFSDGTRDDLENHCPKGSIVGRARATSPLLNDPLAGNVYFVKNVRIDPRTGNQIRTLPMIIVALRGEIAVNLRGESDTAKDGRLVNTFASVPDAPVSQFNLNVSGGENGILAVTRTRRSRINLCTKSRSHVAEADTDGHNGKRHDFNVRMKTPCGKAGKRKAAAKRRAGARRKR